MKEDFIGDKGDWKRYRRGEFKLFVTYRGYRTQIKIERMSFKVSLKGKKYTYKSCGNAINGFVKNVDGIIAGEENKKKREALENEKKLGEREILASTLGVNIEMRTEWYTPPFTKQGHEVKRFYIRLNNQDIQVSQNSNSGLFTVGSFYDLTADKAKQLVALFS